MTIRVGREGARTVRPEWQEELDRINPPSTKLSSLRITYEPGDPWEPIERFCVWTVFPEGIVPVLAQQAISGPHPRSTGHYCADGWCTCETTYDPRTGLANEKPRAWVDGPTGGVVSARQWELYQEHQRFHKLYWIVQGSKGGNRYRWNPIEQSVARLGGHSHPPWPGDLPFAEPDRRTWDAIAKGDLLNKHKGKLVDFLKRGPSEFALEDRESAYAAMEQLWRYLDDQMEGPADRIYHALRRSDDATVPRPASWQPDTTYRDPDAAHAEFLTEHARMPLAVP